MISTDQPIVRNKNIAWQTVENKIVLVSPDTKKIHILSGVGSDLWEFLKEPKSLDELVGLIESEYEVSVEQANADIKEFLAKLSEENIITNHTD